MSGPSQCDVGWVEPNINNNVRIHIHFVFDILDFSPNTWFWVIKIKGLFANQFCQKLIFCSNIEFSTKNLIFDDQHHEKVDFSLVFKAKLVVNIFARSPLGLCGGTPL